MDDSRIWSSLTRFLWDHYGQEKYVRFAIVGHARTGSNLLSYILDASQQIEVHHEIFADYNRVAGQDFATILSRLYGRRSPRIHAVGCKIFYDHLSESEWSRFEEVCDARIIHLMRRNRLRTLVSLDIAFKTQQWILTMGQTQIPNEEKRINLDTQSLVQRIKMIEQWEQCRRERFHDRPMLEVYYEDLVADLYTMGDKLIHFVNATQWNPKAILPIKQNPEPLEQLISNYEEVVYTLTDTPWTTYLE